VVRTLLLECTHRYTASLTQERNMNTPTTIRITSFGFAVVLTLGMMVGVNALAVSDAPAGLVAQIASTNPV